MTSSLKKQLDSSWRSSLQKDGLFCPGVLKVMWNASRGKDELTSLHDSGCRTQEESNLAGQNRNGFVLPLMDMRRWSCIGRERGLHDRIFLISISSPEQNCDSISNDGQYSHIFLC